jgi:hypothetical protein
VLNPAFEGRWIMAATAVVMAVIGYVVFRRLAWRLVDAVDDGGDFLLVRNRGEEERIPLSNIERVSERLFMNPPLVKLHLSAPSRFGREIAFLPAYRLKAPFASSPITLDLIGRTRKS